MPDRWNIMSTDEWFRHYKDIEDDTTDESMAAKAYFRIIFEWDFMEDVQDTYMYKVRKYMDKAKRAWEWLNTVIDRALSIFKEINRQALGFI